MARTRDLSIISDPVTVERFFQTSSRYGTCTTPLVMGTPTKTTSTFTPTSVVKTMTDVETVGFYGLRRSGMIINSPMTAIHTVIDMTPVNIDMSYVIQQYTCTPKRWIDLLYEYHYGQSSFAAIGLNHTTAPVFTPSEIEANRELAITKAHANIDVSELNALVFIAEFPKSIKGLTSTFRGVNQVLKQVRKNEKRILRGKLPKSTEKLNLADLYMEARYNLRPMYYDTVGILKALRRKGTRTDRQTFRSRHSIVKEEKLPIKLQMLSWSTQMVIYLIGERHNSVESTVRAGVLCKLDELAGQAWGIDQVAQAAWDLVPFSFIVDWFINVGDTISSWAPKLGTTILASWIVDTLVTTQSINVSGAEIWLGTPGATYRVTGTQANFSGSSTRVVSQKDRLPNFARPVIPNVSVKLDSLKLLDLAVITGLIKSGRDVRSYRV